VIQQRHCRTASFRTPFWRVAALALAGFGSVAHADDLFTKIESRPLAELWLNPGLQSYHFNREKGFNNNNYGFGAEYRFSTVTSATAGRFYNSDRYYSNYAGFYYQPYAIGPVRVGAVVGVFNGYPRFHDGGWFLAAVPMLSYEYGRVGLNVAIVPSFGDKLHGAIGFQLKLKVLD
jgi:hypothetical protein